MSDYVLISRSIVDWEWYNNPVVCKLFVHLNLLRNDSESEYRGHVVPVDGVVTGVHRLAEALGVSVSQVKTALKHLKDSGYIAIDPKRRFSIITVAKTDYIFRDRREIAVKSPRDGCEIATSTTTSTESTTTTTTTVPCASSVSTVSDLDDVAGDHAGQEGMGCPDGVDGQVWKDFVVLRAQQGEVLNQYVIDRFTKEGALVGMSLEDVLREILGRGWRGFLSDWKKRADQSAMAKKGQVKDGDSVSGDCGQGGGDAGGVYAGKKQGQRRGHGASQARRDVLAELRRERGGDC